MGAPLLEFDDLNSGGKNTSAFSSIRGDLSVTPDNNAAAIVNKLGSVPVGFTLMMRERFSTAGARKSLAEMVTFHGPNGEDYDETRSRFAGTMEGLYRMFSAVKRKAPGFRSKLNHIAMTYFTAW